MSIHQYSKAARARIARSVQYTEAALNQARVNRNNRPPVAAMDRLVRLQEDIEHRSSGQSKVLGGNAVDSALSEQDEYSEIEVWNPGRKVWSGSDAIIRRVACPGATADKQSAWYIVQAWSATRLRGTTTGAVGANDTGTLTVVQPIDGTFEPTTVQFYLPTNFVEVGSLMVVWVELVYRPGIGTSRWEAYSADCDGGA
jgi:hypothetical protein